MRISGILTLSLLSIALLSGCKGKEEQAQQGGGMGGMPPASVEVTVMAPIDVPLEQEYAGSTEGSREVEVRAQVGGILISQAYMDGATVKQGQVLFQIDPRPYQAALDQAKAQLQQAEAQLLSAERNWKRVGALFQSQAISGKDYDDAQGAYESAQAGVALATAQVKTAQLNLNYTSVKAPISGITGQKIASEGSLVSAGAETSLLARISQLDPIYVDFSYPDADFMRQKELFAHCGIAPESQKHLETIMKFGDGTPYNQKGFVDFTGMTVDRQTGTISARAIMPNPDHAVLPGQFVRVALQGLVCRGALLVPQDAVMQGPQGAFVYKLGDKNVAMIAPVKMVAQVKDQWIVQDGLKPGDTVITKGVIKVMPGMPVNPEQPKPEGQAQQTMQQAPPATAPEAAPADAPPAGQPTEAKEQAQ
jgi:membrane fusion protein (multidrug efflux system)